jgi:hypothetical protein
MVGDSVEKAKYFLEKAAQCRRLAASIADDKASEALLKLAEEFEARAAASGAPLQPRNPKGRKNKKRKKNDDVDG